jgi:hypothetical protein
LGGAENSLFLVMRVPGEIGVRLDREMGVGGFASPLSIRMIALDCLPLRTVEVDKLSYF